jgi:hypothetical protein
MHKVNHQLMKQMQYDNSNKLLHVIDNIPNANMFEIKKNDWMMSYNGRHYKKEFIKSYKIEISTVTSHRMR